MFLNFVLKLHVIGLLWKKHETLHVLKDFGYWIESIGWGTVNEIEQLICSCMQKLCLLCNGILRGYFLVILVLTFSFCFKFQLLPSNLAVDSLISVL